MQKKAGDGRRSKGARLAGPPNSSLQQQPRYHPAETCSHRHATSSSADRHAGGQANERRPGCSYQDDLGRLGDAATYGAVRANGAAANGGIEVAKILLPARLPAACGREGRMGRGLFHPI